MVEIMQNFYIGNEDDYEKRIKNRLGWNIIHACKEPYHRDLLRYKTQGAPQNNPEYLIAKRQNKLICNLIDTDDPKYVPQEIIDTILIFIENSLKENKKVLLHCNQGESRSPSIGLLYLAIKGIIPNRTYLEAKQEFIKIYKNFKPKKGIEGFMIKNWDRYL